MNRIAYTVYVFGRQAVTIVMSAYTPTRDSLTVAWQHADAYHWSAIHACQPRPSHLRQFRSIAEHYSLSSPTII